MQSNYIPTQQSSPFSNPRATFWLLAFYLLAFFLLFWNFPFSKLSFIADDLWLIKSALHDPFPFLSDWTHSSDLYYRPLPILSFYLNYLLSGYAPLWYYVVNVCFHLANTFLLFIVLRKLSDQFQLEQGKKIAFAAAFFYLVYPHTLRNVFWVSGRVDLMSGIGILTALLFFIYHSDSSRQKYVWLSLASYIFAFFSKETSVILLAFIVLLGRYTTKNWRSTFRVLMPYLVVTILYVSWRFILFGGGLLWLNDGGIMVFAAHSLAVISYPGTIADMLFTIAQGGYLTACVVTAIYLSFLVSAFVVLRSSSKRRLVLWLIGTGFVCLAPFITQTPQPRLAYLAYAPWLFSLMMLLFENGRNRKLRGIFILSFALLSLYGTREIVSAEREIFDYHSTLEAELRKHINDSIQRTTNNYQLSTNTGDSITPAAGASPLLPPISIMLVAPSRSGLTGCAPNLPLVASLLRYGDLEHPDEGWQCPVYFESGSTADYEHPAGATREDNQIGQSGFLSNINVRKINDHQIELTGSEGVVFVPKPAGKFSAAHRFTRHCSGVDVIAKELWQLKPSAARVCLLTFPRELIHSNAVIFYPEKGKLKSAPIKEFLGGK